MLARGEPLTAHARSAEYRIPGREGRPEHEQNSGVPSSRTLVPYVPGEQLKLSRLVKLEHQRIPYGPSPQALAAMVRNSTTTTA